MRLRRPDHPLRTPSGTARCRSRQRAPTRIAASTTPRGVKPAIPATTSGARDRGSSRTVQRPLGAARGAPTAATLLVAEQGTPRRSSPPLPSRDTAAAPRVTETPDAPPAAPRRSLGFLRPGGDRRPCRDLSGGVPPVVAAEVGRRWRRRRARKATQWRVVGPIDLSIVIPAFSEARRIGDALDELQPWLLRPRSIGKSALSTMARTMTVASSSVRRGPSLRIEPAARAASWQGQHRAGGLLAARGACASCATPTCRCRSTSCPGFLAVVPSEFDIALGSRQGAEAHVR